jgi:hypothetical protein
MPYEAYDHVRNITDAYSVGVADRPNDGLRLKSMLHISSVNLH